MKRFCCLVALMVLSSSAHAGSSLSFVVGGHRITSRRRGIAIPPPVSLFRFPGIYEKRRGRDRDDDIDDAPTAAVPAKLRLLHAGAVSLPAVPPAGKPSARPQLRRRRSQRTVALAAATTQEVAAPAQPTSPAPFNTPPAIPSVAAAGSAADRKPADAARPTAAPPRRSPNLRMRWKMSRPIVPLGDWQTEGHKGSVRIERCGRALCGYVLDPSSNAKGETLLIDMKPKAASEWSGNIYSRDSGNTYYATMAMKGPDSLRVEACALGGSSAPATPGAGSARNPRS